MTHHLAGIAEVAAMLGVSRQRVDQIVASHPDFPRPEAELAAGRIWSRAAVEGWIATQGERRPGRRVEVLGSPDWGRLTDRARRAVVLAQQEARTRNHNYLGCEHLVIGLVAEGTGVAAKALARFQVGPDRAREALSSLLGPGPSEPFGDLPFTPRLRMAIREAEQAAVELSHNYVGTEHLLLGVLRQGDNVGCRLLAAAGVDLFDLRTRVLEELGVQASTPAPSATLKRIAGELAEIRGRLEQLEGDRS